MASNCSSKENVLESVKQLKEISQNILGCSLNVSKALDTLPLSKERRETYKDHSQFANANQKSTQFILKLLEKCTELLDEKFPFQISEENSISISGILNHLKSTNDKVNSNIKLKYTAKPNSSSDERLTNSEKELDSKISDLKSKLLSKKPTPDHKTESTVKQGKKKSNKALVDQFLKNKTSTIKQDLNVVLVSDLNAFDEALDDLREQNICFVSLFRDEIYSYDGLTVFIGIATLNSYYLFDSIAIHEKIFELKQFFQSTSTIKILMSPYADVNFKSEFDFDLATYINFSQFTSAMKIDDGLMNELTNLAQNFQANSIYLIKQYITDKECGKFQQSQSLLEDIGDQFTNLYKLIVKFNSILLGADSVKSLFKAQNLTKLISANNSNNNQYFVDKISEDFKCLKAKLNQNENNKSSTAKIEFLQELNKWRHDEAKSIDIGPELFLPQQILLKIAQVMPKEYSELVQCFDRVSKYLEGKLEIILKICKRFDVHESEMEVHKVNEEIDAQIEQNDTIKEPSKTNKPERNLHSEILKSSLSLNKAKKSSASLTMTSFKHKHLHTNSLNGHTKSIFCSNIVLPDLRYFVDVQSKLFKMIAASKKKYPAKIRIYAVSPENEPEKENAQETGESKETSDTNDSAAPSAKRLKVEHTMEKSSYVKKSSKIKPFDYDKAIKEKQQRIPEEKVDVKPKSKSSEKFLKHNKKSKLKNKFM